ncbi:MAG: hypothetical protein ACFHHU_13420 [Porticoccaceae bacterium]
MMKDLSRVINSFIGRAVDEGRLDPDDFDEHSDNVLWDRTTIRAALGGLIVLILVNLFSFITCVLSRLITPLNGCLNDVRFVG